MYICQKRQNVALYRNETGHLCLQQRSVWKNADAGGHTVGEVFSQTNGSTKTCAGGAFLSSSHPSYLKGLYSPPTLN